MKSAEEIFSEHWLRRTGKKCDKSTLWHMGYVINAMEEYAEQFKKVPGIEVEEYPIEEIDNSIPPPPPEGRIKND